MTCRVVFRGVLRCVVVLCCICMYIGFGVCVDRCCVALCWCVLRYEVMSDVVLWCGYGVCCVILCM